VNRPLRLAIQALSLATILAFAPLAFSPRHGARQAAACAQSGTCCRELGSTCVINSLATLDAYYSRTSCSGQ
jgi:hypothetical protein